MTLHELHAYRGFNTDKANPSHTFRGRSYLHVYEELFHTFRHQKFTLLEIGVFKGGSLGLWGAYFEHAQIIGLDIDPTTEAHVPPGIKFLNASQTDEKAIKAALCGFPPLGIVIDDGSHYVPHMLETFRFLWPMVRQDGVYVMEDTRLTYTGVDSGWPGMGYNKDQFDKNDRRQIEDFALERIRKMDHFEGDAASIQFHPMMIAFRKARLNDAPEPDTVRK